VVDIARGDSKLEADAAPRDSAQLRALIVRLPDSRPRSGRTSDKISQVVVIGVFRSSEDPRPS
jgi:hypothetical protein